jgi:hypothetical protein
MPTEEKKNPYKGVRSMFLADNVVRMRDIEDLYPTKIAKELKINHSRYIKKLYKPEEFTFKHIWKLSKLLDIDIQLIIDVIKRELNQVSKQAKKKSS